MQLTTDERYILNLDELNDYVDFYLLSPGEIPRVKQFSNLRTIVWRPTDDNVNVFDDFYLCSDVVTPTHEISRTNMFYACMAILQEASNRKFNNIDVSKELKSGFENKFIFNDYIYQFNGKITIIIRESLTMQFREYGICFKEESEPDKQRLLQIIDDVQDINIEDKNKIYNFIHPQKGL